MKTFITNEINGTEKLYQNEEKGFLSKYHPTPSQVDYIPARKAIFQKF